ncbi:hypothetical protein CHUAL_013256 [Chamberlinius hualienensis]
MEVKIFVFILLVVAGFIYECNSSRILVLLPISPRSQKIAFDALVNELANRNHDVTYVTMYKQSKEVKGVKTILLGNQMDEYFEDITEKMFNSSVALSLAVFPKIANLFTEMCEILWMDENFAKFTNNPGRYDVVLVNSMLNECYLAFAGKLGAPIVILSVPALFPNLAWALDIPNPISYLPAPLLPYHYKMTFFQRVWNFLVSNAMHALFTHIVAPLSEQTVKKYIPDAKSAYDIVANASLLLTNTHVSFEGPRPSMPYMVEVGCMHCNPGKSLPKDLQTFIHGSGNDGFIVFSLGTVVKGRFMNDQFVTAFVEAFGQLKQRVIWKYEKQLKNLPPNVMIVSWLPQQDLMAHPMCKLAITHGGYLSLQEVAYHGVPLLGVPLGADRIRNIFQATEMGFALPLNDWQNLTKDGLLKTLKELLYNPKYREHSQQLSALMKDRPEHPLQTAMYWIEYIIRNKGAPHLKSGANHLNIFQYFLIDVICFLALVVVTVLFIIFKVTRLLIRYLLRLCSRSKTSKQKKRQ